MAKLEIYGIAIAAFIIVTLAAFAGGYVTGMLHEKTSNMDKQQKADLSAIQTYAGVAKNRATADAQAAEKTTTLIAALDQGLTNVKKKFASLPAVVVDARGCPQLTDTARLRWNTAELLPAGSDNEPAGGSTGALSTGAVSPPR